MVISIIIFFFFFFFLQATPPLPLTCYTIFSLPPPSTSYFHHKMCPKKLFLKPSLPFGRWCIMSFMNSPLFFSVSSSLHLNPVPTSSSLRSPVAPVPPPPISRDSNSIISTDPQRNIPWITTSAAFSQNQSQLSFLNAWSRDDLKHVNSPFWESYLQQFYLFRWIIG